MDHEHIAGLRISLASPEEIRSWSSGEVTEAETVNFRTHKPVPGGLFCERIFGPTKDWTCACRKYTREREPGFVCEQCGVEVAPSRIRRERLGHIELATPVVHPWFTSILPLLLQVSTRACASVIAFSGYLVTSIDEDARHRLLSKGEQSEQEVEALDRLRDLAVGAYLDEHDYQDLSTRYGSCFRAGTGTRAAQEVLARLDLSTLADAARQQYHDPATPEPTRKRVIKRLQALEAFRQSGGIRPEWMVLTVLPVLPPDLRPLVPLDGGRLATTDLNSLYERVLHRNARIRRFEAHNAPDIILNQERRMLQEAVEALLDNAHKRRKVTNARRQPLKSLTHTLSGKTGRFRLNLLGKRVDYSGRSVIVGNPQLRMHQCGLPKKMACELFKPFLMRKLVDRGLAHTVKHAKRLVERRDPVIWDQLAECLFERVVLLNRAPTLHRLSIQAFEPVLVEGGALQLHPQVCSAFNADFDGDQMAVHLPLSDEAQAEARDRLLSIRNLRSPASGDPSISISQEQVLGLFYLTEDRPSAKRAGRVFTDMAETMHALEAGVIDVHTTIIVRIENSVIFTAPGQASPLPPEKRGRIETTAGRLIFNDALPDGLRYKNYPMTKDTLKHLVVEALTRYGEEATAHMCDVLKTLGFHHATRSGISFAISDIKMAPEREHLIGQGRERQKEADELYHVGEITDDEWSRQVIALWTEVTEQVSQRARVALPEYGTLMTIVKSGATKAKFQQIRQLCGIRGLMASPTGKILPIPILSNYLLGMLVWEIFIAASGARKGFMDRSLNTAASGYLTRKLVECGMPVWITRADCHTTESVQVTVARARQLGLADMRPLIIGRVLARPVAGYERGTLLTEKLVEQLLADGVDSLWVRTPLTCQASVGLCQHCYGGDPSTGRLVRLGTAVGIIAGQSIGEPGTQLTMRTFHSGGIANAQGDITQGLPRVSELFEAKTPKKPAILTDLAGRVIVEPGEHGTGRRVRVVATHEFVEDYPLPPHCHPLVTDQQEVLAGHMLARSAGTPPIDIRAPGPGRVIGCTTTQISLRMQECEERCYDLAPGVQLAVEHGQQVQIGDPLTQGAINPRELLQRCGVAATSAYLVNEVQRVYRTTGVSIRDQHLETIVRQMLRYVQVREERESAFLPGEIVDRFAFEQENARILAQGGEPASGQPILLGLTRTVLQTSSWIAAASFQETSRVLMHAAMRGQRDPLWGLKEKIVVGLRIPVWGEDAAPSDLFVLQIGRPSRVKVAPAGGSNRTRNSARRRNSSPSARDPVSFHI